MRNRLVLMLVLLGSIRIGVAQNLVPNPSFEAFYTCPYSPSAFNENVPPWYNAVNTPTSFFHACDSVPPQNMGVPHNHAAYQPARTGEAYVGFGLWFSESMLIENFRNYVGVELTEPLQVDTAYCVQFFLSLSGRLWDMCAVNSAGMYFSVEQIYDSEYDTLSFIPQIQSDPDSMLIDTVNWMRVGGTYVAQGGEKYITIGNFKPDDQTQVFDPDGGRAFYYLDDVSVERCSQVGVSANGLVEKKQSIQIIPNPASREVTIRGVENSACRVISAIGQTVKTLTITSHQTVIDVRDLPNGIYTVVQFETATGLTSQAKLVILH